MHNWLIKWQLTFSWQFEDFANHNAFELLAKYLTTHLVSNVDIQLINQWNSIQILRSNYAIHVSLNYDCGGIKVWLSKFSTRMRVFCISGDICDGFGRIGCIIKSEWCNIDLSYLPLPRSWRGKSVFLCEVPCK